VSIVSSDPSSSPLSCDRAFGKNAATWQRNAKSSSTASLSTCAAAPLRLLWSSSAHVASCGADSEVFERLFVELQFAIGALGLACFAFLNGLFHSWLSFVPVAALIFMSDHFGKRGSMILRPRVSERQSKKQASFCAILASQRRARKS
jgi:hypothetical protein